MDRVNQAAMLVRFGPFEMDRHSRELRRAGERIPLQIQPFAVLECLVDRAGEVVTRDELRAKVWPSTVYVDFNHGLNNAIARLRQALGDTADAPVYIETLPRIGYRFICPVESVASAVQTAVARPSPPRWRRVAMAGGVAVFTLTLAALWWLPAGFGTDRSQAGRAPLTSIPAAQDAYLRGLELLEQRRKESIQLSIVQLSRATELDPGFAAAHAALAMAFTLAGGSTLAQYRSANDVRAPALAAARRALELDPNLPQAHVALAGVLNQLQPWSEAGDVAIENAFRRALELDPASSSARLFLGNFLSTRGRTDEAVAQFRKALEGDPLSPSINSRLGMELVALGQAQEGLGFLQRTVELDPWQFNAQVRLGWAQVAMNDLDAAQAAFEAAERISPRSLPSLGGLAFVAARRGDESTSRRILDDVLSLAQAADSPFEVAIVYVALEERDDAIEWLTRTARKTRTLHMAGHWGIESPIYDWLRDDPRFAAIEREVTAGNRRPRQAALLELPVLPQDEAR